MTIEETIKWLKSLKAEIGKSEHISLWHYAEAIDMAIEALKAQDRPIICPRCGRTFSEAEGRESEEIQGLEYAENILENILREQDGGRGMNIDDKTIAEAINDITKWRTWSHTYDNACMDGERNEE